MNPLTSNVTKPDSSHESKVRRNFTDESIPCRELLICNDMHPILQHLYTNHVLVEVINKTQQHVFSPFLSLRVCKQNIYIKTQFNSPCIAFLSCPITNIYTYTLYLPSPSHSVVASEQSILSARLKRIAGKRNAIVVKIIARLVDAHIDGRVLALQTLTREMKPIRKCGR